MESKKKVDWVTSKRISDIIDSRLGECLANSVRAFLDYPEALPPDAVFIEGIYNYGGQFLSHTWIETTDSIIDLTLVHDKSSERDYVRYYPVHSRDKSEIKRLYEDKPHGPGSNLLMTLNDDDPKVMKIRKEYDPPG